ncbi:FAD-linked oxidoreductase azaG, partial [Colletotrichum shisoi]
MNRTEWKDGRHGYTTTIGDLDNGLAVDLSLLNDIKINKGQKTLTVGPGVKVNEILDRIFPANMASAFFKAVETYSGRMPAEMAFIAIQVYDPAAGQSQVMTNWIYVGPGADARRVLAPILDLRPPYAVSSNVAANKLTNSTLSGFGAAMCQEGVIRDIYSVNERNYSAATWDKTFERMARFFEDNPGGRGSALQYKRYPNQAMSSVSKDETAWPWRDATGY